MRRPFLLLALALLTLPLLAAPAVSGQTAPSNCSYYRTIDQPLVAGYSARLQRYRCEADFGSFIIKHRADIVRMGEGPDERVITQLEMHAVHTLYTSGAETREFSLVLRDVSTLVPYSEVEYRDSSASGACAGTTAFYYGISTSPLAASNVPCLPVTLLMP